jgi:hypothetical protein
MNTSGGFLWAWGENEIWCYTGGEWSSYAAAPEAHLFDVAYVSDTLWAVADFRLQYLEGDDWQELEGVNADAWSIEADDQTEILWVSDIGNLYRWNCEEMTDNSPSSYGTKVGEIAVTGDGTVWAAGMNGWLPWLGGLARYDDTNGSWEMVRPWRADEDVPAQRLASTPNGNLWVVLADWSENWEALQAAGKPFVEWALAHWDGVTGVWSVFDEDLPEGLPLMMAADDEAVWLVQFRGMVELMEFDGLASFDGETWSHYLTGTIVQYMGVGPDGTIWYTNLDDDRLHLLR